MHAPDDPRPWGPPWAWGERGPGAGRSGPPPALRWVVAVDVLVVQLGGTRGAAHWQPGSRPLSLVGVLLLLVAPVAIVVARRAPRAAMVATAAAVATYLALAFPYGPVFVGLAVMLVATVVRGHRLVAWAGAALVLVGNLVGRLTWFDTLSWNSIGGTVAWTVVVLSLAEVFRGWRERVAAARAAAMESRRRRAGEERLRIAQELHDVVAHHMSLINVQAGVALHLAQRNQTEQVEPALQAIKDSSKEALGELRSLIDVLRTEDGPAPRSPGATIAALDDIVDRSRLAGLEVTKTVTGQPRPLPAAVELAAYRIVQEAITNVVRHAHARSADVVLGYGDEVLTISVDDDGTGGSSVENLKRGNGIHGMTERARALGGDLELTRSARGGLRVAARIPTGGAA